MIINILGYGAVVKKFIHLFHDDFPGIAFQFYLRQPDVSLNLNNVSFHHLESYQPDGTTICCLSVNEESILKTSTSSSRLTVAKPNLELINQFIAKGFFNSGRHYILTNPSELIAEYIIKKSGNNDIYALGLSVDEARYKSILPSFGISPLQHQFDILGNHYQYPIINFHHYQNQNINLIHDLLHALSVKTRSEFTGFKPPISGGVNAMLDIVNAIYHKRRIMISGYSSTDDAVIAGYLTPDSDHFHIPSANIAAQDLLETTLATHRSNYQKIAEKV
ncbi:MAG TPA: hypothetical protein VL360_07680 [Gammaproteobacteria bacterium]|nr:hypothetical protein [Gammaproteobacteria bacterium]